MSSPCLHKKYVHQSHRDEKQRKVIALDEGHHLVLASAGCGKTEILAERVKRAILNGHLPDEMLCLTFTNRAARGMRSRIASSVGDAAMKLFVGNIHRFCSKFLFEQNIVSESCAILDEDEAFSIIESLADNPSSISDSDAELSKIDYIERNRLNAVIQLQHLMLQYSLNHPREVILQNISDFKDKDRTERFFSPQLFALLCKESGSEVTINSLLSLYEKSTHLIDSDDYSPTSKALLELLSAAKKYEDYKRTNNLIDFDDLLILTYSTLKAGAYKYKKFNWIQVDEVQDLNQLQFGIIDLLSAPQNVTLYLGDEQQAIFSFIGAKLSTLDRLKAKCKASNIHHLDKCYRSPSYLLNIFNDYATNVLNTDPDFLPTTTNEALPDYGDLKLIYSPDYYASIDCAVKEALANSDGRTAILVNTNSEADQISERLDGTAHFKISGEDLFSSPQVKLILSHLNVVYDNLNYLAWARILHVLGVVKTFTLARNIVIELKNASLTPDDFYNYNNSAYVLEFLNVWNSDKDIVVFDTETTGLNILEDDIVQIAANKYRNGTLIDSLNIILDTTREIPQFLGDLVNPLVKEYKEREHISRKKGLMDFMSFAKDCVIIGHNVKFDLRILINNYNRELDQKLDRLAFREYFDTLKLSKLLFPQMHNYKLGSLLQQLSISGNNSHLADADIVATYNLAQFIHTELNHKKDIIIQALNTYRELLNPLTNKYSNIYKKTISVLDVQPINDSSPLLQEINYAYNEFVKLGIKSHPKFGYLLRFIEAEVVNNTKNPTLYQELESHIVELNTFKEADMCDSQIIDDKIFVATVHKAKGLEFENVIVFGCVDGSYPFFANQNDPDLRKEDARKLYVAITRAKKRLCLLAYNEKTVKTKKGQIYRFNVNPSPFISHIVNNHNFITLQ